jgi:hypothetical protein
MGEGYASKGPSHHLDWRLQNPRTGSHGAAGAWRRSVSRSFFGRAAAAKRRHAQQSPLPAQMQLLLLPCVVACTSQVAVAASIVLHHFAVWASYPEREREGYKFKVRHVRIGPRRHRIHECLQGADHGSPWYGIVCL